MDGDRITRHGPACDAHRRKCICTLLVCSQGVDPHVSEDKSLILSRHATCFSSPRLLLFCFRAFIVKSVLPRCMLHLDVTFFLSFTTSVVKSVLARCLSSVPVTSLLIWILGHACSPQKHVSVVCVLRLVPLSCGFSVRAYACISLLIRCMCRHVSFSCLVLRSCAIEHLCG